MIRGVKMKQKLTLFVFEGQKNPSENTAQNASCSTGNNVGPEATIYNRSESMEILKKSSLVINSDFLAPLSNGIICLLLTVHSSLKRICCLLFFLALNDVHFVRCMCKRNGWGL